MTSFLIIATCSTAIVGIWFFRQQLLAVGHAMVAGFLEFKARLKAIDDELGRR